LPNAGLIGDSLLLLLHEIKIAVHTIIDSRFKSGERLWVSICDEEFAKRSFKN
jgi:hypothetical protein